MQNKLNDFLDQKRKELSIKGTIKLSLKITANAQKNLWHELLPTTPPSIKTKIKAVPENGKANKVLEKFVGKFFKANAEIVTGHTNNLKIIEVNNH